jgi:hypothetical protein
VRHPIHQAAVSHKRRHIQAQAFKHGTVHQFSNQGKRASQGSKQKRSKCAAGAAILGAM